MTNGDADLVMLQPTDYLRLRNKNNLIPLVVGAIEGTPHDHTLLLVPTEKSTLQLADLKGARIGIDQGAFKSAPMLWLQTRLRLDHRPNANAFFSDISISAQTSQPVMRAFFGQANACLVSENVFLTMNALNPQL